MFIYKRKIMLMKFYVIKKNKLQIIFLFYKAYICYMVISKRENNFIYLHYKIVYRLLSFNIKKLIISIIAQLS